MKKQSLVVHRDDFWASTNNKQLNFLQHVFTILKQHGRAAIVVADNVLFFKVVPKNLVGCAIDFRTCEWCRVTLLGELGPD